MALGNLWASSTMATRFQQVALRAIYGAPGRRPLPTSKSWRLAATSGAQPQLGARTPTAFTSSSKSETRVPKTSVFRTPKSMRISRVRAMTYVWCFSRDFGTSVARAAAFARSFFVEPDEPNGRPAPARLPPQVAENLRGRLHRSLFSDPMGLPAPALFPPLDTPHIKSNYSNKPFIFNAGLFEIKLPLSLSRIAAGR
jgi:hypothetical protein